WSVRRERLPRLQLELQVVRLFLLPESLWDMLRALPVWIRVHRTLRRKRDLLELLRSLERPPSPTSTLSMTRRGRTIRGLRWLLRLLPHDPRGGCLVRALALHSELSRQGWPVAFI